MTVPNIMAKAFFYQDLRRGRGTMCPPLGMVRQKYPGADRVNDILCLNFLKDLLIPIKYNFWDILHCPKFLLRVIKKMLFSKISTYHQSLRYNFNLNQDWRKLNIPLLRAKIGFFISWFFCKKFKIFEQKLIYGIKRKFVIVR